MATAHRFQILQLEQKQFEQVAELARYIYQKKHGEPVVEPEEAGKKFLALLVLSNGTMSTPAIP